MSTQTSAGRRPIAVARDGMRLQHAIAFMVMALPILGTGLAAYMGVRYGLGIVEIGSFLLMYLVTMGGMTIGLHRYFAHRAFKTSRAFQFYPEASGRGKGDPAAGDPRVHVNARPDPVLGDDSPQASCFQ